MEGEVGRMIIGCVGRCRNKYEQRMWVWELVEYFVDDVHIAEVNLTVPLA